MMQGLKDSPQREISAVAADTNHGDTGAWWGWERCRYIDNVSVMR